MNEDLFLLKFPFSRYDGLCRIIENIYFPSSCGTEKQVMKLDAIFVSWLRAGDSYL